jgi:hypothetical protein
MSEPRSGAVPPVRPVTSAQIADLLAASATTSLAELAALGPDGGWRPEPGEWSANECVGHHPDVGPLRVDELLREWVHHDCNHIRQLLAVTQARVWAQMGNARRFSQEDL